MIRTVFNLVLTVSVILVGYGAPVTAERTIPPEDSCAPSSSCPIAFDHLATQETDPFLFLGKVVDQDHPQWVRYRKAIRRYSDVQSCLIEAEQNKEAPNLFLIDWDSVGTGRILEVCVFRISSSLGNFHRIEKWLEFHGFAVGKLTNYGGPNFKPRYETQPVFNVTAKWTIEQYRQKQPSLMSRLTGIEVILGYYLVLAFDASGRIANVGVSTPSK